MEFLGQPSLFLLDVYVFMIITVKSKKVNTDITVCNQNYHSTIREITIHIGSHSVTCHSAAVTFPPLPQPKLVLDLAISEKCKAELTL